MKRLRIKLLKEFNKESEFFKGFGMQFKYNDLHTILLPWRGSRCIIVKHDLSTKTTMEFRQDLSDVPIPILRASIGYFKEHEKEKRKILN